MSGEPMVDESNGIRIGIATADAVAFRAKSHLALGGVVSASRAQSGLSSE